MPTHFVDLGPSQYAGVLRLLEKANRSYRLYQARTPKHRPYRKMRKLHAVTTGERAAVRMQTHYAVIEWTQNGRRG